MKHGLRNTYAKGCRCAACRAANAIYAAQMRARRARSHQKPRAHNASTYQNYGCRCRACRSAQTQRLREYWLERGR